MLTRLRRITHHLLQPDCAFCGEPRLPDYPLCQACHDDLPWLAAHHNHAIPGCDNSISAFAYQTPISPLLLSIKFGKRLRDLTTLGELTAVGILPQISQLPQAILPVPLHPQRLHERGFNQALELARPLAKQLGIPLLTRTVVRQKATLRQTELDSTQRQQNVLQAFHLNAPLPSTPERPATEPGGGEAVVTPTSPAKPASRNAPVDVPLGGGDAGVAPTPPVKSVSHNTPVDVPLGGANVVVALTNPEKPTTLPSTQVKRTRPDPVQPTPPAPTLRKPASRNTLDDMLHNGDEDCLSASHKDFLCELRAELEKVKALLAGSTPQGDHSA